MFTIDLGSIPGHYDPSHEISAELFAIGLNLARAMPDVRVRVAVGPDSGDRAVLDGRVLSQEGVALF